MAWTPYPSLLRAVLNNRGAGRVTGWARFVGLDRLVLIDLVGDLGSDIRGEKVILLGPDWPRPPVPASAMRGFALEQTGQVILMTAGHGPATGLSRPHFEWHSDQNGQVLLAPLPGQVQVVGQGELPLRFHRYQCQTWPSPRRPSAKEAMHEDIVGDPAVSRHRCRR